MTNQNEDLLIDCIYAAIAGAVVGVIGGMIATQML